jgi:methyl coenzyme M reductase beta subunit
MAKYKDTIDLYDDEGKLLKSNVTLEKISPVVNKGALNVIDLTKRTVAVNFAGIEEARTAAVSRTRMHSQPRSRTWSRSKPVTTPRSPR